MATQEGFITRRTRTLSPLPGDGICPTVTQHHDTVTASYEIWAKLVSEAKESMGDLHIADDLLELLQQIPGLYAHHLKGFSILDQPNPQLKYALEWVTTTDPACELPIKRTYHYQTLGVLRPLAWEYSDASENNVPWLGRQADQMKHLSCLILAWAYILSSRWVEILNTAGEMALMNQSEDINGENFWEVVVERQWQATMTRGDKTFYAPWCMERHPLSSKVNKREALPDSLYAFRFLEKFCLSEGVTKECAALALAVVLMFPEHRAGPIKLAPLAPPEDMRCSPGVEEQYYKRLSECLSQCITLSCCDEGIASLLCSGFFEPKVSCNLIGAHLFGVRKAVEPVKSDPKAFARLMVGQNPKVSSLWLAAIWTGQASKFLDSGLGGMPSISLPVASWTGVLQSFIQVGYHSISNRDGYIPRAREFSAIYLVRSDAIIPFTSSPPFGEIAASDISLDIRRHLLHDHKPIQSNTYWIFETGELYPAQKQPEIMNRPVLRLPFIARASNTDSSNVNIRVEDAVDRVSSDATLNLFVWYRHLEGGLRLEENQGEHGWIIYDSDEDDLPEDEESKSPLDVPRIWSWRESVIPDVAWDQSAEDTSSSGTNIKLSLTAKSFVGC